MFPLLLTAAGALTLVLYLLIFLVIVWVLRYAINALAPEPMRKVLTVVLVVVAVVIFLLFLINRLDGGSGLRL